jgi:predicted alpha/beta hydrolase family esterase
MRIRRFDLKPESLENPVSSDRIPDPFAPCILILPGYGGSGPAHWQTFWEQANPNARRVEARDWYAPDRAEWVWNLQDAVQRIQACGRDLILVAHSLACLQVVHWAVRAGAASLCVRGALLVAPPDPDGPEFPVSATGFAPLPLVQLPFPVIVVGSTDDVYATTDFSEACANAWGARFVNVGALGHINAASGLGEWPEGQRLLDELS